MTRETVESEGWYKGWGNKEGGMDSEYWVHSVYFILPISSSYALATVLSSSLTTKQ